MTAEGVVAYIDGGARGNPGPAGFGVRIERQDGTLVEEFHDSIGTATNNVAEYRGLIAALEWAKTHGAARVHVRSDSLLLVQQMLGNYKVKHPGLQPLYGRARVLAHDIGRVTFEHVERAKNAHADRLANAAMDRAAGLATTDRRPTTNDQRPAATSHPFTALERAIRLFIYRHFLDTTRAPALDAIVRAVGASEAEASAALRRLADAHAIVLAPASLAVWMAHPFSAVPTNYPVETSGRRYWANCAWDAAGILSIAGADGSTETRCADCGEPVMMSVRGGAISGDGVVHFAVPPRRFWDNVAYT